MGPYLGTRVPIGTFFGILGPYWVSIYFSGSYFQCFGFIHAKNVNLVCTYTTMSYLDLSVMILYIYHPISCEVMLQTLELLPLDFYVCLRVKFHKSSFWVLILAAGGPY